MKKSLVSLGLATALLVPAGAVYAQSADVVALDETVTCRMVDGVVTQNGFGAEDAVCSLDGEQLQLQLQLQNGEGEGNQYRAAEKAGIVGEARQFGVQNQARLADGDGPVGDPADCPFDGDRPQSGLGNVQGRGFGSGRS